MELRIGRGIERRRMDRRHSLDFRNHKRDEGARLMRLGEAGRGCDWWDKVREIKGELRKGRVD